MNGSSRLSRRDFLGRTASAGAAGVVAPALFASRALGANSRIRLGFIGVGDRGSQLLRLFLKEPDVEVTAICDVWGERLAGALTWCPKPPQAIRDYRDLLARDDVDAVVIATPPHWHALQAIHAFEAGKDVYIEKPMTISVGEGLAVLRAAQKHKRITQVGTQIHAEDNYRKVVDIVRSGVLGKISVVRTLSVNNQGPQGIGRPPDSDAPADLDWDLWCGPAPKRAFNPLIVKRALENSSFLDYSAGWTPGMAAHLLDLPYWALELGHPHSAHSCGGRYVVDDIGDGYDTHDATWQFPKLTLHWHTCIVNTFGMAFPGPPGKRRTLAIAFHGVNGTLVCDYNTFDILPERDAKIDLERIPEATPKSPGHCREWLDAIRARKPPSCHIGYHYKIDVAVNLSLMALKLGRSVQFDPGTESIPADPEANKLMFPTYRDPWKMPKEYT